METYPQWKIWLSGRLLDDIHEDLGSVLRMGGVEGEVWNPNKQKLQDGELLRNSTPRADLCIYMCVHTQFSMRRFGVVLKARTSTKELESRALQTPGSPHLRPHLGKNTDSCCFYAGKNKPQVVNQTDSHWNPSSTPC